MWTARLYGIGLLLGVVASTHGAPAPSRATTPPAIKAAPAAIVALLRVSPEAPELKARPTLVARLRETPHNYFRYVNRSFSEAVCGLFDDVRGSMVDVNLHGDAHIEQYAVTSLGRGLTDFDDSARGPYVIDLVRFGVSLQLTARQKGWAAGEALDDFLRGYREALAHPGLEGPPQATIRRARTGFAFDHALALRRAEALIDSDPLPPSELAGDFQSYINGMRTQTPSFPASFFRIKKAGRLTMGIGSGLDEKYLLRIEGWTTSEDDDQVLEAKLVHPPWNTRCLHSDAGPGRVPLGMSLIARAPFLFSGLFVHGDRSLWVHAWTDDYVELSIPSSFPEPRDLRQVAYDVGTQLARAHPKPGPGKAAPRGPRALLLESTRTNEGRLRLSINELTEATVDAWKAFRGDAPPDRAAVAADPGRAEVGGRSIPEARYSYDRAGTGAGRGRRFVQSRTRRVPVGTSSFCPTSRLRSAMTTPWVKMR